MECQEVKKALEDGVVVVVVWCDRWVRCDGGVSGDQEGSRGRCCSGSCVV